MPDSVNQKPSFIFNTTDNGLYYCDTGESGSMTTIRINNDTNIGVTYKDVGPIKINATSGLSGVTAISTVAVCNEMKAVFLMGYGNNGSYANQIHIISWNWTNNTLNIKFVGDIDTYPNVYIGMLWK